MKNFQHSKKQIIKLIAMHAVTMHLHNLHELQHV